MYYIVINGEIKKTEEQNFWDCDNGICVVKLSEWNESPGLREKSGIWHKADKNDVFQAEFVSFDL